MRKRDKLWNFVYNLVTSGSMNRLDLFPRSRVIFSNSVIFLGVPILLFFGQSALRNSLLTVGLSTVVTSCILIAAVIITRKTQAFLFLRLTLAIVMYALFLYLGITGGTEASGILWVLVYPVVGMFVLGIRWGTILTLSLLALMSVTLFVPQFNLMHFSLLYSLRFLGAYFTLWIISLSYQISMEASQKILSRTTEKLINEKEQTDSIMNHVEQGLFLLEEDFHIGESHSKSLAQLLQVHDPSGIGFLDLLRPHLSDKDYQATKDYLEMYYRDDINPDLLKEINPLDIISLRDGQDNEKILRFGFGQVAREGDKPAILGIVSDITEEKRLQDQLKQEEENYSRSMEHLFQIIHIAPPMLQDFLDQSKVDLGHVNTLMKSHNSEIPDLLNQVYQLLHSIKGNAVLLGLQTLGDQVHAMEDMIKTIQEGTPQWDDLLDLTLALGDFQQVLGEIEDLVVRIRRFSQGELSLEDEDISEESSHLLKALGNLTKTEAQKQGKRAKLDISSLTLRDFTKELQSVIRDVSTQMIRNSLAHGLETPEERKASGKTEEGTITLSSHRQGNLLIFRYRDDGTGIDIEKIRRKLKDSGTAAKDPDSMTQGELLRQIFAPGFSTTEDADMSSGRGVGMNVIKDKVNQAGGKLKMSSKPGQFTQFSMEFQLGA